MNMQSVVKIKRGLFYRISFLLIREETRKGFLRVAALGNYPKPIDF